MKPLPNFYTFFGITPFTEFTLNEDQIYDRLLVVLNSNNHRMINSIMSKFETGIYILSNDYVKERYDYILLYGWITILSNPLKVLYVWYIITLILVRMRINLVLEERRGDPQA